MPFEEVVAAGAIIAIGVSAVVLYIVLTKGRILLVEHQEAAGVVKAIVDELRTRMAKQDERIMEQQVKLEIVEAKVDRALGFAEKGRVAPVGEGSGVLALASEVRNLVETLRRGKVPEEGGRAKRVGTEMGGEERGLEKRLLSLLAAGPRTSREIQAEVKRSREHTARLMKGLHESGLVARDESERPYVYELTTKGRAVVQPS